MPTFPIVPAKTALLFFDVLNTYLHPDDPEAQAAVYKLGVIPKMQRINMAARAAGIAVFYVQADHEPNYLDFVPQVVDRDHFGKPGEKRARLTEPVIVPVPKREIIPEIAPQPGDYIIKKHRWSSFFQTHLELSLRAAGIDTIMYSGGSPEVGLGSTAYSARDRDFSQIMLRDACTAANPAAFDLFMDYVFPRFCRVMMVEDAIAQFQ